MKQFKMAAIAAGVAAALAPASMAVAQDNPVKMSVVAFLSGPAAGPFGVPSRNGAEVVIEAINKGQLPAPYNSKGLAGRQIEVEFIDEAGGNTKQVAEYRNMVEKRGVDVALGYISSGTCAALTPVAEELKKLTVFAVCGTPRIFEENKNVRYVFRTMSHATSDNVAAAFYVKEHLPKIGSYTAINQNYAWGQDSWRDFDATMALITKAKPSEKLQWPKIFQGQYSTEISALLLDKADLIHTSFWDGDLESFIFQGQTRGLFKKKKVIFTVGETSAYRLNKRMPDGVILGARGPYGAIVRDRPSALNKWLIKAYQERYGYGTFPPGPAYQYAQAVLAVKYAYDTAAKKAGGFPTQDQVIDALAGAEFESFSTTVKMALGNGHQAITENGYGITKWDAKAGELKMEKVKFYPAECVNPPEGVNSVDWIKGGMKGAKCS